MLRIGRFCVLLVVLLVLSLDGVHATASRESQLSCAAAEVEPNNKVVCTIRVRDTQQEPTMSFSISDFLVEVASTSSIARVTVSAVQRGTDITTAVFDISATHGTTLTVKVNFQAASGTESYNPSGPVRHSGLTVLVLSQPATTFGTLTCSGVDTSVGLALRQSTTCTVDVFDSQGLAAVVAADDISFSEENRLGTFRFLSGKRALQFTFQAPDDVATYTAQFALQVRFKTIYSTVMTSITFPLSYPTLAPSAAYSAIHCDDDLRPILCTVYAADAEGPVAFTVNAFTVNIERWVGDGEVLIGTGNEIYPIGGNGSATSGVNSSDEQWYSNTGEFVINMTANASAIVPATRRPDVGLLTFVKATNEKIQIQRLRVGTKREAAQDVAASPFYFHSGKVPSAAAATLRGCDYNVIASNNVTHCYVDLLSGISGDTRYFTIRSTNGAVISNVTYVEYDQQCRCRTLRFTYTAPVVSARVDDYIAVAVWHDGGIVNSPLRMNVLPADSSPSGSSTNNNADAAVVAIGVLFFGSIFTAGTVLIIRRNRKGNRIRKERAAKVREHERASSAAVQRHLAASAAAAGTGGNSSALNAAREQVVSTSPRTETPVSPGVVSSSVKTGFISNAAVEQERLHSDSD